MSFLEAPLRIALEATSGARVVALVGLDGMIVATAGEPQGAALDVVVASYADLVRRAARVASECGMDGLDELSVSTGDGIAVVRVVTSSYGLLGLLDPGGSFGRMRYELHKAALALLPELED